MKRKFYMIPPTFFSIDYSINFWMDENSSVNLNLAQQQWEKLFETYIDLGAEVEALRPVEGLPDQIFAGDSIFIYDNQAIIGHFSVPERQAEVEPMISRFQQRGLKIHMLPDGINFEGNAEAIKWNDYLLAGYGVRSDKDAHTFIADTLSINVISLEIKSPFFHLDMCVCPLNASTLAYVPDAFTDESRKKLEGLGANLVAIELEEAMKLACNSMAVNNTVILSTKEVANFPKRLRKLGFEIIELDLSEFAKSGGGAKCLTLEAYPPFSS